MTGALPAVTENHPFIPRIRCQKNAYSVIAWLPIKGLESAMQHEVFALHLARLYLGLLLHPLALTNLNLPWSLIFPAMDAT